MEVGEIDFETDQEQSVWQVAAVSWAQHTGVRNVPHIKKTRTPN